MRRLAFLSMDALGDFVADDELAHGPLARLGWQVESVSWRCEADWSSFAGVVIRTPWDYWHDVEGFLRRLEEIEAATALANPLPVVRWNLHKSYLLDLERRGVPVVPTWLRPAPVPRELPGLFRYFDVDEIVVKPAVGANAERTFRLRLDEAGTPRAEVLGDLDALAGREVLVQPFLPAVVERGEASLFWLGGMASHAILKTPSPGDFRVQEEHGGVIRPLALEGEPGERLLAVAEAAVAAAAERTSAALLYARVDLAEVAAGDWRVMELELIEPSLYLRMDPSAPRLFAVAIDAWLRDVEMDAAKAREGAESG